MLNSNSSNVEKIKVNPEQANVTILSVKNFDLWVMLNMNKPNIKVKKIKDNSINSYKKLDFLNKIWTHIM